MFTEAPNFIILFHDLAAQIIILWQTRIRETKMLEAIKSQSPIIQKISVLSLISVQFHELLTIKMGIMCADCNIFIFRFHFSQRTKIFMTWVVFSISSSPLIINFFHCDRWTIQILADHVTFRLTFRVPSGEAVFWTWLGIKRERRALYHAKLGSFLF